MDLFHHNMVWPQVADGGENLQIWRLAAKILKRQSQAAEEEWSSNLQIGQGAYNSSPQDLNSL
jgi:hypothetical protein